MAVKYLSGNRVTALSTDLITATTTPLSYTAENGTSYVRYTAAGLFGELIQTGNNLIGEKINSVTLKASRHNSGTGGTVLVGVFDNSSDDSPVHTFWTGNATDLPLPSPNTPVDEIVFGKGGTIGGTHTSTDSPTLAAGHVIGIKKLTDSSSSSDDYVYYRKTSATTDSTSKLIEYQSSWSSSDNGTMYLICKGGGTNRLGTTDATTSIDDDFSDYNFTSVPSSGQISGWGVSSGVMNWIASRQSTSQGEYIALPSTITGDFLMRFKLVISSISYNTTEKYSYFGLTNSNSCDSRTDQNTAGMYFHNYSLTDSKYQPMYETNTGLFSQSASPSSTDIGDGSSTRYIEISKSGDTLTLKLFPNNTYSGTADDTATSTGGSATDSYTHFVMAGMRHPSSTGGGNISGTIDDLVIYSGISSGSAISTDNAVTVPNGSVAEETDTGKHKMWNSTTSAWVEVG